MKKVLGITMLASGILFHGWRIVEEEDGKITARKQGFTPIVADMADLFKLIDLLPAHEERMRREVIEQVNRFFDK